MESISRELQVQSSPVASHSVDSHGMRGRIVIPAAFEVAGEPHDCLISSDHADTDYMQPLHDGSHVPRSIAQRSTRKRSLATLQTLECQ